MTKGGHAHSLFGSALRTGDFQAGDEVALLIEGGGVVQWDTLTVEAGPLIDVPTLGPILLEGVLRSELETHIEVELGRFIQLPRVQARRPDPGRDNGSGAAWVLYDAGRATVE